MSSRLKIIVPVGLVAIAATWLGTNLLQNANNSVDTANETAYQRQLALYRKKQEDNAKSSQSTENRKVDSSPIASAGGAPTAINESISSGSPNQANQVSQHIQNTLKSLQNIIPSGSHSGLPVSNYDANAQRMQYLSTMPLTVIESTRKPDAMAMARVDAGRIDPFGELEKTIPFPKKKAVARDSSEKAIGKKAESDILNGPEGLPPPPSSSASLATDVPPPPPPPGIELDELPPPPEKPMLSEHLKLNAIVGDQIILAFKDRSYPKKNHFKQYITLSQGQEFDSLTVIDIGRDQATLEEHGKQITMRLDPIR